MSSDRPVLILAATLAVSACATPQEVIAQRENNLAAAGFVQRPANTPARQAMLDRLPAQRFVRSVHGDEVAYVYADPIVCGCLYVGSQQAYANDQRTLQQQALVDQQETTAQLYSDTAWNWSAWGAFGGYGAFGPQFGFGAGDGW